MTDPYQQWQVPERVARLKDLVYNIWWSWHPEARALFKEIDRNLWRTTYHNPVLLLQRSLPRLNELAKDEGFLSRYDSVIRIFDEYLEDQYSWFARKYPQAKGQRIAYFSAEFGLHNSLRIYSGGLGILAGDHCKTASDLGVPLVGIGFMYPQGYVQQRISVDGWQQNVYEQVDWSVSPIRPVMTPAGDNFLMSFSLGPLNLKVAVWEIVVGRVRLYLMDTHVEGNSAQDREISGRLYGGDRTMRLRQEILLGIGGARLLKALDIPVEHYHINEGHSAFMFLEKIREQVAAGKSFEAAAKDVASRSVFTTHTPVEAGHDVFSEGLVAEYFGKYWGELGLDQEKFLELGRVPGQAGWNMTALALKLSGQRNGVSKRHGIVSRHMWTKLWPERKEEDVPIGHVTNGVHLPTWLQQDLGWTFFEHLGRDWPEKQDDPSVWAQVAGIPDEELWRAHMRNKGELLKLLLDRARDRWISRNAEASQVLTQGALLSDQALTIGFARRFAGYKRATLILRDLARLKSLLLDHWRPIQLVFAGKSHPADDSGKALIQQIYHLAKDPSFGGRIVFVEDYDMHVARYFVQGCDLWLNNPLAPLEACGTSGIKAAVNGVPSLSVLDGWWEEGCNGANGWAIGAAGGRGAGDAADAADAEDIYQSLEKKIVPLFYDRGPDGVPHGWIKVMKESIKTVAPRFCGNRMVKDYVKLFYGPEAAVRPANARTTTRVGS
ncbi:MAG: alpha-glucan family phosphorylase [Elusimicrobia bacterium]|nr:alpha-glucan family phosphorylase [Elusimicrobiota bacterium]